MELDQLMCQLMEDGLAVFPVLKLENRTESQLNLHTLLHTRNRFIERHTHLVQFSVARETTQQLVQHLHTHDDDGETGWRWAWYHYGGDGTMMDMAL